MSPFISGKAQAHSRSISKFNMHGNEEHNESEKMEVDSVVALELQPTKLKIIFSDGIFSSIADSSGKAKGATPVLASMLEKL
jgi:hypothetical protein